LQVQSCKREKNHDILLALEGKHKDGDANGYLMASRGYIFMISI